MDLSMMLCARMACFAAGNAREGERGGGGEESVAREHARAESNTGADPRRVRHARRMTSRPGMARASGPNRGKQRRGRFASDLLATGYGRRREDDRARHPARPRSAALPDSDSDAARHGADRATAGVSSPPAPNPQRRAGSNLQNTSDCLSPSLTLPAQASHLIPRTCESPTDRTRRRRLTPPPPPARPRGPVPVTALLPPFDSPPRFFYQRCHKRPGHPSTIYRCSQERLSVAFPVRAWRHSRGSCPAPAAP